MSELHNAASVIDGRAPLRNAKRISDRAPSCSTRKIERARTDKKIDRGGFFTLPTLRRLVYEIDESALIELLLTFSHGKQRRALISLY